MRSYKNNPEGFNIFRNQILAKTIPVMVIILVLGLCITYFSGAVNLQAFKGVLIYVAIIVAVLVYSNMRALQRQRAIFNSYELIITDKYFLRKQQGLPDKTILFSDVDTITEAKNGHFGIKGQQKENFIFITPYIQNLAEVKSVLQSVKPVTVQQNKSFIARYPLLPVLATGGLLIALYTSKNKTVIGTSGLLLLAVLIWSFYKIRSSTSIDSRIKRNSWWVWVVIISIALMLYYKVFSGMPQ